jgi:PAS domain S-box-containing protein
MTKETQHKKIPYYLIAIFLLLSVTIWVGGYLYYQDQKKEIKKDKLEDIAAIADLKVSQIVNWRQERLGDAKNIFHNKLIIPHIQQFLAGSTAYKQEIFRWLETIQKSYLYKNVILLDTEGNIRLKVIDGQEAIGPDARKLAEEAMIGRKIIFSDLYRSKIRDVIRITIAVPLLVSKGSEAIPIGTILLRVDPYQFLYPLIQSWPTPSRTSETVLFRREGNEVLFLNELRHKKDTALKLRFSINEERLPSTMAMRGITAVNEAVDYRGVPVLAVVQPIPDSPWFLVAKIDQDEIYAPIHKSFKTMTFIVSLLIFGAGIAIGLIWRHQRARFYREKYETELEKRLLSKRYEYLTLYANDIILSLDPDWKIVDANEKAVISYGYTLNELLQMNINTLRAPEARDVLISQMKQVQEHEGLIFETMHQKKDGTKFPVEVSSREIDIEGKKVYQHIIRDISDRKKAETELQESEERLRTVIEASMDAIIVVNEQGKIVLFNTAAEVLFLYPSDEALQKPASILLLEETADDHQKRVEKFLNNGVGQCGHIGRRTERTFRRKDGTKFDGEITMAGGRSESTRLVVVTIHDITERKKAEAKLLEEKLFSDSTINSLPGIFYLFDENGRFLRCNRNMETVTGYSAEEILVMNPLDFFAKDEKALVGKAIQDVLMKGESSVEASLVSKTESRTPYFFKGLRFISGDKNYVIGTGTDISEIKKAEEALKALGYQKEMLLNAAGEGIFGLDINGNATFINPAACRMLGLEPHEVIGKNMHEIHHHSKADGTPYPREKCPIYMAFKDGEIHRIDNEIFWRKDGSTIPVEYTSTPMKDGEKLIGAVVIFNDITERKISEENIARQGRVLEAINSIFRAALTCDTEEELARAGLSVIEQLTGSNFGFIGEINQAGRFDTIALSNPGWDSCRMPESEAGFLIKNMEICSYWGRTLKEERPQIVNDPASDPDKKGAPGGHLQIRNFLGVPLKYADKTIGMIALANKESDYTVTDQKDVETISIAFIEALYRKRMELSVKLNESRILTLLELNQMIDRPLQEITDFTLEDGIRLTGSKIGYLAFMNEDETILTMHAWSDAAMQECAVRDKPLIYPVETTGLWGEAVRQRRPIITNDYSQPNLLKRGYPDGHVHVVRHMNVPVFDGDRIVAVAGVGNKPTFYNESDVQQLTLLIEGMWSIIRQQKAKEEIQKLNEELEQRVIERTQQLEDMNRRLEDEIVERKQIEKALKEEELRYRALFEQSPEGILLIDPETALPIEFNETALRQLGYSHNEFAQMRVSDYEAIEKPEDTKAHIEKILREGRDDFETKHRTKNGEIKNVLVTVQMLDLYSKPVFHCIYRDITELKQAEIAISELNEMLQHRALELEAINKELEAFSYSVSHDLRAPLRSIDGFSKALLEDYHEKLEGEGRDYLQRIRKASQHMGQLIDDLLNLSRVARNEMHQDLVDLSEMVKEIASDLQEARADRIVKFIIEDGVMVKGDSRLLRIFLENLIGNAWKFTEKNPDAVIQFGSLQYDGKTLYFIRDNGAGFDMTYANKLFGAFQRLHTQAEFPGTGIGLAIVYRIIQRHGGKVWAEGEPGKGATFYFTL